VFQISAARVAETAFDSNVSAPRTVRAWPSRTGRIRGFPTVEFSYGTA
jgi:hypothetical protein